MKTLQIGISGIISYFDFTYFDLTCYLTLMRFIPLQNSYTLQQKRQVAPHLVKLYYQLLPLFGHLEVVS